MNDGTSLLLNAQEIEREEMIFLSVSPSLEAEGMRNYIGRFLSVPIVLIRRDGHLSIREQEKKRSETERERRYLTLIGVLSNDH